MDKSVGSTILDCYETTSLVILLVCAPSILAQTHCVEVSKIWITDHSAFTSLIKFKGDYYCSFRRRIAHFRQGGKAEGKVRIIKSSDGINWESVALLNKSGYDLRDPVSITPTGKLMVIIGGSIYEDRMLTGLVPQVSFSDDGRVFTDPLSAKIDDSASNGYGWIWRVTWEGEVGYAAMYSPRDDGEANLYLLSTRDGVTFDLITGFDISGFPNEATIRFDAKGDMLMMVRREKGNERGYWGKSSAPYTDWTWKEMEVRLGGPDFIHVNDDLIVMGTRSYYTSFPKTVPGPETAARSSKRCTSSSAAIPATRALSWRETSYGELLPTHETPLARFTWLNP